MAFDPNLPRWIFASVSNHFKTIADANNLPLLIEGIEDRTSEKIRLTDHAELRINGPIINEISRNYYKIFVNVNILIQSMMTEQNAYILMQNCGVMLSGMRPFDVFKFGIGPDDDDSYVGCLTLRDELSQPFGVNHFGQLKEDVRLRESIVTGHFKMYL